LDWDLLIQRETVGAKTPLNPCIWRRHCAVLTAILSLHTASSGWAQSTSISITGPTYNQSFDTLPNTGTFTFTGSGPFDLPTTTAGSLNGWAFRRVSGNQANAAFRVGDGSVNSQGVWSFGAVGSGERALGSIGGPGLVSSVGALFVNNSGSVVNSITISFTGEQWRRAANANTLSFQYSVGATSIATGTFTSFSALNFTGPQTGTAAALNGNLAVNQVNVTATITGLNWTAGSNLAIRWNDANDPGADAGLGIDNFSLTIPEPGTVAAGLAAIGLLGWAVRRRCS
jgi:PEP-CTERM motif